MADNLRTSPQTLQASINPLESKTELPSRAMDIAIHTGYSGSSFYTTVQRFRFPNADPHWRLVAENEIVLLGAYWQRLNPEIRTAMDLYNDGIRLESFLQRTTRVSQRLAACQPSITAPQPTSMAPSFPVPEPMQIDTTHLSRAERNHRITLGLCLYCGQQGHLIHTCPIRTPCPVMSTIQSEVETASLTLLPVTLHMSDQSLSVSALVASGSSGNFISQDCLNQLQLSRCRHFQVYSEEIRFLVLEESTVSIILECPWLRRHRLELRWDPCDVTCWNEQCYTQYLSNLLHPRPVPVHLASTHVESPEPTFTPENPAEYACSRMCSVSKQPPIFHLIGHGTVPSSCCLEPNSPRYVYTLSIPERQAREEYFAEALSQGFIQPSSSLAASSFFFVGKKDGGLRPCIDYRQLNSQNLQQTYPLPLVPAALEELRGARVFMKLDLRSAYNLVRIRAGDTNEDEGVQMDQGKVNAIQEWPQPCSVKELQRFPGFSNFYRRFIRNYSSITALLTSLQRGKLKHLTRNPAAHKAFQRLKNIFSTATLLHQNYLREARCLNPRQARWALFFTRFNFKITYHSKNISADALSRQFSSDSPSEPEPVIPPNLIVSPILWDQDQDIQQATLQEPAPPECPEGKIYVPCSQRQPLLGAAHQSPGSGHPGSKRTLSLLQARYWWPSMRRDTIRYVQSCSVCAMSTSPHQLPTGSGPSTHRAPSAKIPPA
ncbi:Transposon Tf2-8 polyprotein [Labeo rohita]|uniref:Gypsy retrotransposon integrase-like protein 1 n=1 Tax=Labeo rohita TaxID=84645 RepID=A0ABQ8LZ94_LABRO|nr:Transposon Tf2-8 polyprotein [Labeo rohita]